MCRRATSGSRPPAAFVRTTTPNSPPSTAARTRVHDRVRADDLRRGATGPRTRAPRARRRRPRPAGPCARRRSAAGCPGTSVSGPSHTTVPSCGRGVAPTRAEHDRDVVPGDAGDGPRSRRPRRVGFLVRVHRDPSVAVTRAASRAGHERGHLADVVELPVAVVRVRRFGALELPREVVGHERGLAADLEHRQHVRPHRVADHQELGRRRCRSAAARGGTRRVPSRRRPRSRRTVRPDPSARSCSPGRRGRPW